MDERGCEMRRSVEYEVRNRDGTRNVRSPLQDWNSNREKDSDPTKALRI